jgi:hypothetical protein
LKTKPKHNYDNGDDGGDNDDEKELTILRNQPVKKDPFLTINSPS